MSGVMRVLNPGFSTTIQDLGRPGHAKVGVGVAGAADASAHELANRLVGNAGGTPTLESTLGGLTFEIDQSRHVSVTGAPVAVSVGGCRVSEPALFYAPAGERVSLSRPSYGLRSYVAVAGGIDVPHVLGSASTDTLSGIGPKRLCKNSLLALLRPVGGPAFGVPLELTDLTYQWQRPTIHFRWGPRAGVFDAATRHDFLTAEWAVTTQINRVGARLSGPRLTASHIDQPSEGMVSGTIQVPPSGQPIIFLADHPTTGGYPVIGVVTDADIALVAQSPPESTLSFLPV